MKVSSDSVIGWLSLCVGFEPIHLVGCLAFILKIYEKPYQSLTTSDFLSWAGSIGHRGGIGSN